MKQRNLVSMFFLTFITFGIYSIYWFVSTKGELNQKGAQIPTAWLLIVPLVNLWWMYKYYKGAEQVTAGKISTLLYFLLGLFVSSLVPMLLGQNEYNKLSVSPDLSGEANPASPTAAPQNQPTQSDQTSQQLENQPPLPPQPPTNPAVIKSIAIVH